MDFLFQFTKPFEKDLRKLGPENRKRVAHSVEKFAHTYTRDRASIRRLGFQPRLVRLVGGFDSTRSKLSATSILTGKDDVHSATSQEVLRRQFDQELRSWKENCRA